MSEQVNRKSSKKTILQLLTPYTDPFP